MPAFTSFLNLYKPGGGSTGVITPDETADIDRLNEDLDLIDAFASAADGRLDTQEVRNQQFTGPTAGRASVTGMKRGDTYQETDVNFDLYWYDGSDWKNRSPYVSASLVATTAMINGTVVISWTDSIALHYHDSGGFWATGAPTEILLKRPGWYRVTYAIRGNGVAPINGVPKLTGATLTYAGSSGVGAAGASSMANRTFDVKAAANAKITVEAVSTAAQTGTHNFIIEYLGEY